MTQIVAIVLLLKYIYMWVLFYITFQNNNMPLFKNKEVYAWCDGQMKAFKMLEIIFGNTKTSTSVFCFVLYFIFSHSKNIWQFLKYLSCIILFSEEYKLRSQLNFKELLVSIHHFEKLFFVRSHHLTKQSWNKQKKSRFEMATKWWFAVSALL